MKASPAASVSPAPMTSLKKRWKKTAWRASSTCWVARKYFCSSFGRGVDVGGEAVGDRVLAVEEHRVDPQRRLALDLGQRLPALAVLAEVDVVGLPVALLPALVEVLVGDLVAGLGRDVVR